MSMFEKGDTYTAIRCMYFENDNSAQFEIAADKLRTTVDMIHKMLDYGYTKLQRIVKTKY